METNPAHCSLRSEPSDEEIRDFAFHLYQESNCQPGHDLDNWLKATACLKATNPAHPSGPPLQPEANKPEAGELRAIAIGAGTLFS